jgi:diguanylate cyclase (GGDEF)-like protein
MGLDIKTLFVVDVAVLLMTAAVSFTLWFQHRDIAGLLWWSFATAAEGLAMLIVGFFGPVLPPAMGLPAALLFVGGLLMAWESMRRFNGRPAAKGRLVILLLAFAGVLVAALLLGAALHQRVALLLLALALCTAASAWEVTFGGTPPLLRSRFALTAVFCVTGVLLARQAILTGLLWPDGSATSLIDLLGESLPMINSIGILSLCFGLVMTASERASGRYRKLALTDDLTGLPNRRFLLEQGGRLGRQAELHGSTACVLMMDLDHFAEVNKRFGHAGGDLALAAFADLLRQHMRPTDTVARYGGEEFCALLMGTDREEAARIAERLRAGVAGQAVDLGGHAVGITVSIGVARLRDGDLAASLRDADAALYRAKALGRNRVAAGEGDIPDPPRAMKAGFRIVR